MKNRPETIEQRWDILYKDYPDVYEKLAESEEKDESIIKTITEITNLKNKVVVDIGSGTGTSTFKIARYSKFVYGVEPEKSMIKLAIKNANKRKIKNVKFLMGRVEKMPLKSNSVDAAIAITSIGSNYSDLSNIRKVVKVSVKEVSRILKKDGYFIIVSVAPYWSGGELAPIIYGKSRKSKDDIDGKIDKVLRNSFNFKYKDVYVTSNFGSVRRAVEVYGFIFGKKAIEYLKKYNKSKIKWKFRIFYRKL